MPDGGATPAAAGGLNPIWLAQSKLRRRRFDECIALCTDVLQSNPYDQAAWYLKCRALTLKNWIDDTEIEEEGVADLLLDENNVAQVARPGTSLARPATSAAASGSTSPAIRPMSSAGRPITGFARPGTGAARPGTGAARPGTTSGRGPGTAGGGAVQAAMRGAKPGTARPVTTSGRFVRLGTASLAAEPGGPFINTERLDLRKYAARPNLARVLCDYIVYVDHDLRRALELAAAATQACGYEDWWWKARLGKAYYQLGMLQDAEQQLASSLRNQARARGRGDMVSTALELAKVHLRLDQPTAALALFGDAAARQPWEPALLLGAARVHDAMGQGDAALALYQQARAGAAERARARARVLAMDASSVEAIACLAAHHYYADQPEVALRHFRRLLQAGVSNAELWGNVGLAAFGAGQYDVALPCFERALGMAGDGAAADIWYNLGQVAISIGDATWAQQCLRVAVGLEPGHAEAWTNLAVLEMRRGNDDQARALLRTACAQGPHVFEAHYNAALLAWRQGDYQEAWARVGGALAAFPGHTESQELRRLLRAELMAL
ncbi:MAG: TRP protein for flagellar function [Monoraphidium minutum]|nr:MAG: TRP protein for flagellar function [Monoraphidium minutum]